MKKFFVLLLTILMVFSLVACGTNNNNNSETTPPTDNDSPPITSVFDENFSLETTDKFLMRLGNGIVELPISYKDFVKQCNFISESLEGLGSEDNQIFVSNGKINNSLSVSIYLKPNENYDPLSSQDMQSEINEFTVVGIKLPIADEIELPFKVNKDDTFETIQAKMGETEQKMNEEVCFLFYEMENLRMEHCEFSIAFIFDKDTKKIDCIKCGDFVLLN